jgi:ribosomal protein RSM22 (predicted rRNA methylase)
LLPQHLQSAISDLIKNIPPPALQRAADDLSQRYRANAPASFTAAHRAAYLATRLPATYAAIAYVLNELQTRLPDLKPQTLLDLGAGPGTATLAADETIVSLQRATLVERDHEWHSIATKLVDAAPTGPLIDWQGTDVVSARFAPHDLVVLAYSFNEFSAVARERIGLAWHAARQALIIVEPGTPANFANVLAARDILIQQKAHIIAPCPHHNTCPLAANHDWCHFAVRVQRSALHRRLKQAELAHEDEKFSYLIASKLPAQTYDARIVRHPLKHKGHVKFTLCTASGLKQETVSKKQGSLYKQARSADWGDAWPPALVLDPERSEGPL